MDKAIDFLAGLIVKSEVSERAVREKIKERVFDLSSDKIYVAYNELYGGRYSFTRDFCDIYKKNLDKKSENFTSELPRIIYDGGYTTFGESLIEFGKIKVVLESEQYYENLLRLNKHLEMLKKVYEIHYSKVDDYINNKYKNEHLDEFKMIFANVTCLKDTHIISEEDRKFIYRHMMRLMEKYGQHIKVDRDTEKLSDDIYLAIGLKYTSGPDAYITYDKVPRMLKWKKQSYDGVETIMW